MSSIKIIKGVTCNSCRGQLKFKVLSAGTNTPMITHCECMGCDKEVRLGGARETEFLEDKSEVKNEAIKSDGGKSDYYEVTIDGQTFMIEKIIKQVFRNDFDFGNAFKALIRANALIAGGGKEGSTIEYEMNKVKYSADQVVKNNE